MTRNGGIMDSGMLSKIDGKRNLAALRKAEEMSPFCCWNCFTKNRERLHSTEAPPVTSSRSSRAPLFVWASKPVEKLITAPKRKSRKSYFLGFFFFHFQRFLHYLYQPSTGMFTRLPEYQFDLTTPITANYDEITQIISHAWDDTKLKGSSNETNNCDGSHECWVMLLEMRLDSEIQSCFKAAECGCQENGILIWFVFNRQLK